MMQIKSDEFPLYGELTKAHKQSVAGLVADMAKAEKTGDVNDAYSVALGLYQLSDYAPLRQAIPSITDSCVAVTKAKCVAVFKEAAAAGHHGAREMMKFAAPQGPAPV